MKEIPFASPRPILIVEGARSASANTAASAHRSAVIMLETWVIAASSSFMLTERAAPFFGTYDMGPV